MTRPYRVLLMALTAALILISPALAQDGLFGERSTQDFEIGWAADNAVVVEDPCGDPKESTKICVGDEVCLRNPDHPGGLGAPFLVPPGIDGCPDHYSPYTIPTVSTACTAAHIMTPDPPACQPDCCKSRSVTISTERTISCCTKTKTRICTKDADADADTSETEGH